MELFTDNKNRELKPHGTYGFPVYVDKKPISAYPTGSFPWHWHDEVEFTLVLSGRMEYRINDCRYLLEAGRGLFCNSGALHAGSMAGGDCEYISITFHPRLLAGFEGSAVGAKYVAPFLESQAVSSLLLSPETPWQAQVLDSLGEIFRRCTERTPLYELYVQKLLTGVWLALYENCAQAVESGPAEDTEKLRRLRAILSFLHAHYAERLALEDVAKEVGLCKSECCRFFKRQMGTSLFDYLLDYRVGKSLISLQEGRTVAEAAAAAGFGDASYFAKVFRSRTGRSPSAYRKETVNSAVQTRAEP